MLKYLFFPIILASIIGCEPSIRLSQHREALKQVQEIERLRIRRDSVITQYFYRDSVIERPGVTIFDTITLEKERVIHHYIKDPTGTTALRVDYDSVTKNLKIQCESLAKKDSITLREIKEIQTLVREQSSIDIKEPKNGRWVWKDIILVILSILFLSLLLYVIIRKRIENRKDYF